MRQLGTTWVQTRSLPHGRAVAQAQHCALPGARSHALPRVPATVRTLAPSARSTGKLLLLLSVLFLFSCNARQEVRLDLGNSADLTLNLTLSDFFVRYLQDLGAGGGNTPVFDTLAINQAMEDLGVEVRLIQAPEVGRLEMVLRVPDPEVLARDRLGLPSFISWRRGNTGAGSGTPAAPSAGSSAAAPGPSSATAPTTAPTAASAAVAPRTAATGATAPNTASTAATTAELRITLNQEIIRRVIGTTSLVREEGFEFLLPLPGADPQGYRDDLVWIFEEYQAAELLGPALEQAKIEIDIVTPRDILSVQGPGLLRRDSRRATLTLGVLDSLTFAGSRTYLIRY